ncbi:MAG: HAD-IIIA family hydrolase [Gemmatimonadaceae bacterium]|nr:HAD-IIIA family hydrolase [Chitinophagaceae bacterium]
MLDLQKIDQSWTLFLDRDGVINHEKHLDYIYNYEEFLFYEGATHALKILADNFGIIVIVTNQRGIGKQLMSDLDLMLIHNQMLQDIEAAGGRIDAIYYCSSMDNDHPDRKPNSGMAKKAKEDFAEIDFSKSIIVGNNISDMEFGRNAGMHTVYLKTTHPDLPMPNKAVDMTSNSLLNFARALVGK